MKFAMTALLMLAPLELFAETITIGTFNTEFLYTSKVHVKYGLRFTMSQNTQAEQDQWAPPLFRAQRFDQAIDAMAPVIADIDPDVLVLPEVGDGADLDALVQSIEDNGTTYPHVEVCSCNDPTGQHIAILSKRPFVANETMRNLPGREGYEVEPDDPDEQLDTGISKGMRVAIEAENSNGDDELVYVFGLHLTSERGGHEQDQQRIAQASIVRRHMIPLLSSGKHVIVAGDMNDRRGQPTIRRLRGMDDIWPDLIQTGHWQFFEEGEEASRWTYQFRGELNQIDHILLSYSLRKNQTDAIRTSVMDVPVQDNPQISDHRPMIVSIEMP